MGWAAGAFAGRVAAASKGSGGWGSRQAEGLRREMSNGKYQRLKVKSAEKNPLPLFTFDL
jgi:hypothetical protein